MQRTKKKAAYAAGSIAGGPGAQLPPRVPYARRGGARLGVCLAGFQPCFGGIFPCYAPILMPCSVISDIESIQLVLLSYGSSCLRFVSGLTRDVGSLNAIELGQ